jgi:hypothetical protein
MALMAALSGNIMSVSIQFTVLVSLLYVPMALAEEPDEEVPYAEVVQDVLDAEAERFDACVEPVGRLLLSIGVNGTAVVDWFPNVTLLCLADAVAEITFPPPPGGKGRYVGLDMDSETSKLTAVPLSPPVGSLEKTVIDQCIRSHLPRIQQCYQSVLTRDRTFGGKVVVRFVIGADGGVFSPGIKQTELHEPKVETCVLRVFQDIEFPPPKGGGVVIVAYPFQFIVHDLNHEYALRLKRLSRRTARRCGALIGGGKTTWVAEFTIVEGLVTELSLLVNSVEPELAQCLEQGVRDWTFPRTNMGSASVQFYGEPFSD